MTKRIIELLKKNKKISDYRINTVKTTSYELFFVHKDLETVRSTETTDTRVTIYVKHGDKLGDSTFPVYASYTDSRISEVIEEAVQNAEAIENPTYKLPAEGLLFSDSDSNFSQWEPEELASEIADAVFSACGYKDGSINALEVFLYRDEIAVQNSCGTDKKEIRHRAMIEAIPTWNADGESVEIYEDYRFTEFDSKKITQEIDRKIQEVRDRYYAKKPDTHLKCNVVLNAPELAHLLQEISGELNYRAVFNKTNAFEKDAPIQKNPCGDKLTVTLRGKMKGSVRSSLFDTDGTGMKDTVVIQNGIAINYYGDSRFAQYLGEIPTGNLPCIEVEAGTLKKEELQAEPYFECVSMSGLQLDLYNDYIGGEVRLAYYVEKGTKIPLTGISISGKLSQCLSEMRLTEEETVYEGYKGPEKALFRSIEIV